jgi:methylmalonyl-CoA decarboxylase subunit alpha
MEEIPSLPIDNPKPSQFERLKMAEQLLETEEKKRPTRPGRQSARERLKALFDADSGQELFRFARNRLDKPSFQDGLVCASGEVNGRPVLAWASEVEIQGGSIGALQTRQLCELYRLARQSGLPLVALVESGGARVTDGIQIMEGYAETLKEAVYLSGVVPQITCILGHCIGAPAFVGTLTDFIIMDQDSTLCVAGASVNKAATGEDLDEFALGGPNIHTQHSGAVHFVEANETAAIARVRELLSYLPSNQAEVPPHLECLDPPDRKAPELNQLLPENPDAPFDIRLVIETVVDQGSFLEVQAAFAANLVTGFARLGGQTVGIIANQSLVLAGALDSKALRKLARFLNFLSTFNYPLVSFVDVPGLMPNAEAHREGILTYGSMALSAIGHLKGLKVSVAVRRCFGGAYFMLSPKVGGGDLVYAWPGAMIGIMSDHAMASFAGHNPILRKTLDNLHAQGSRMDDPFIAAAGSYLDDIIEPAETRLVLIRALQRFSNKRQLDIPPKWLPNTPL